MRLLSPLCCVAFLTALLAFAMEPSDPELNQLDLELRTYAPANDWITPYASNGPFSYPITQLAVSGDNLLAVSAGGYWVSPNAENWSVINRLPPDMLATTAVGTFIDVPGIGLMETVSNGQFSPIRSPVGRPVTDLSEIDDELYAANASASIFSASETEKVWKRLPVVSQGAQIRSVAAVGKTLYAGTGPKGEIYQSTNRGSSWIQAGRLSDDSGQFKRLVFLKDEIFAVTNQGLFKRGAREVWQRVVEAPAGTSLYSVVDYQGRRYCGTDRGLYLLQEDGSWSLAHALLSRGPVTQVSYVDGTVFASTKNGLFESKDNGRTWSPTPDPLGRNISANGVVRVSGGQEFVASSKGLFTRQDRSDDWTRVTALPRDSPVSSIGATDSGDLIIVTPPLEAANQPNMLESADSGQTFRQLPTLPYPSVGLHIAVVGNNVFALPDHGAFLLSNDRKSWRSEDSLAARVVFNIVKRGKDGFAAMTPENIFLRPASSSSWTQLHVQIAGATGAWFDPSHPEVVVAISGSGLSWNSDIFEPTRGVQHWVLDRPLAFQSVFSICQMPSSGTQPATLLIGTDYGVYLLVDKLHRAGLVARSWRTVSQVWGQEEPWLFVKFCEENYTKWWFWPVSTAISFGAVCLVGLVALILLAWRKGSTVFARNFLISKAARPLLIVPGLGRRVLFIGYDGRLRRVKGVAKAIHDYFGLPADGPDGKSTLPDEQGDSLHNLIADEVAPQTPVIIVGTGGAGKSTLLARLTSLGLDGRLPQSLQGYRPVLVPANFYTGSLIKAIGDTLRERDGVAVTEEIVVAQLQSGRFLVLFDGLTEVAADDKVSSCYEIIRTAKNFDFGASRFVIATRPIEGFSIDAPLISLKPLTADVVLQMLPRFQLGTAGENAVKLQLRSFGSKPLGPLLLVMILNQSGSETISRTRADLYEAYFRRLLRADDETPWDGWRVAFEHLAQWFFLDTGKRGLGLPHSLLLNRMAAPSENGQKGENLISTLRRLYRFPVKDELELVQLAEAAGLLVGGRRWRFAHDTFEEYFAASRLLSIFEDTNNWPALGKWVEESNQQYEFLEVINFINEMTTKEIAGQISELSVPTLWKSVLSQAGTSDLKP